MIDRLYSHALFAVYQVSVALAIMFLPIALLAQRVGVRVPAHRLVEWTEGVYRSRSQ